MMKHIWTLWLFFINNNSIDYSDFKINKINFTFTVFCHVHTALAAFFNSDKTLKPIMSLTHNNLVSHT